MLILGFHGCDREVAKDVLTGKVSDLEKSRNKYDWLGHGIYFWEGSYKRALDWANLRKKQKSKNIKTPFVIGAVIEIGNVLDLIDANALGLVKEAHKLYIDTCHRADVQPAQNKDADDKQKDLALRYLDCAVMESLHGIRENEKLHAFDCVRAFFNEGERLYPGSGFNAQDHVQICVRNPACIKGYFLPKECKDKPL